MSIIYPPLLSSTIPGFTNTTIDIPFKWNPAVGKAEVKQLRLVIKDLKSNIITTLRVEMTDTIYDTGVATFSAALGLSEGEYYKFQMSYEDTLGHSTGTLSAVAIGRCVGRTPSLHISRMDLTYIGEYITKELSESVLSYRF
jgi:hypothetical protein